MIKLFARTAMLSAIGIAILLLMNHYGLFAFSNIARAFQRGGVWVAAVVSVQVALAFILVFRYGMVLRLTGVKVPSSAVFSANFVSNAVGQWAPGALAVTEVLRISLMLGAEKAQGRALSQNASRLAVTSVYDRCIGFFTMLTVGGFATVFVVNQAVRDGRMEASLANGQFVALVGLAIMSLAGSLSIALLPFAARLRVVHIALDRAREAASLHSLKNFLGRVQSLVRTFGHETFGLTQLLPPVLLSLCCMGLSCLSLWCAAQATGDPLPLFVIFATFPITAIATLFPLGFGGMGGYQLVAVGVFGLFGVAPAGVSTASVLQNALALLVNTLLGALYAHHSGKQIVAILKREQA
ncbi:MAG: flippase-like domain-containing protein [Silvanigrellales bacterium]|nr:flippase-like domain-containing protein [Silvanigrellales bacterium]